jgi:formate hydrogenlyase subunit 3/multisubunit Na+/H+ antiporter MnhD subunit
LAVFAQGSPRLCSIIGVAGAVAGCGVGLVPAAQVLIEGTTLHLRLPWTVPFGSFSIELDPLSAFFALPILVLCGLGAVYGAEYLEPYRGKKPLGGHWFFYNALAASMVMVVVARNGVLFLVSWEVMSLAAYFLVVFEDEKPSVREAGRTYLIATHLGTAFLLVLFLLLGQSGSLDYNQFAVPSGSASLLFLLAVVGFGTKAGFMPFHVWLPEAHPAAPSHVSAVMSGVMVKTGIYGLIRTLTFLPQVPAWWGWLLVGVGGLSGVWGILFALAQHDLKRMLAYSTVENIGVIALGLGLGVLGLSFQQPLLALLGFAGALLHVANHSMFKGLLFLGAGVVLHATGTRELDRLGGLSKRIPWVAAAFLVGAVAIVGVPPLNGFVGEFLIYSGAFDGSLALNGLAALPALGVIGALALVGGLAAAAFTKIYGVVFLGSPRTDDAAHAHSTGPMMAAPLFVLATGCLLVGLFPGWAVSFTVPAASGLARLAPLAAAETAKAATGPLWSITVAAWLVVVLVLLLASVRRGLLVNREVTASGTWGCGYTAPSVRMQYTASSYVQPAIDFFAPFIRQRKTLVAPTGLFPSSGSFASEAPDLTKEVFYTPVFSSIGWVLSRLRWLQHGRVHVYVLYIAATIVALLVWYLGMRHP